MTILVTGAAGKTGRALIAALASREEAVRALVHRAEQAAAVRALGAHEVAWGDMRLPGTHERAMMGVRAVYHICPNLSPDEAAIGRCVLEAARAAGVRHFVYHSVLHPQTEEMPHHWQKLRVEEQLFESGLPYTILQPAAYMQNVLAYWDRAAQEGVYAVPYAPETRLGMVDLLDVAEAGAVVLTRPGHEGATYELCGVEVLTQAEIATELGRELQRPVQAQAVALDEWERGVRAAGLGEYQVDTLRRMFRYYERYGFWGNPLVLTGLLGRPPVAFAAFVERAARERMGDACVAPTVSVCPEGEPLIAPREG
jgi:NAD(P)H dehydrogenase (quinone)